MHALFALTPPPNEKNQVPLVCGRGEKGVWAGAQPPRQGGTATRGQPCTGLSLQRGLLGRRNGVPAFFSTSH